MPSTRNAKPHQASQDHAALQASLILNTSKLASDSLAEFDGPLIRLMLKQVEEIEDILKKLGVNE